MINRANTRRIAVALALGAVLLVSYPAVSGGVLWDLGAACGYVCLILFVCLYIFPVRGDGLPHARLLGLSQHKSIGWCVLGTAAAHVAIVLLVEPLSTRYLLPSAPLFMWCGVVAILSVVASVITGLSARSHMRRSPSTSRATIHIVLATLLMLTACAHVIGSSQMLSGVFKPTVVLLLLSLPLGWYALDLGRSSEATFHTFCRDCHTQLALDSQAHGPTRSCAGCHQGIRSSNL